MRPPPRAQLADDGWQLWDAGIGGIIDHNGQTVRRISLRRDGLIYGKTYERHTI